MRFKTKYSYISRSTKAKYIFLKYQSILKGNILDVGADECYLKKYLDKSVKYIGVGLNSDKLDHKINLEKSKLPFRANSFDLVLCSDVLEHLANIHSVFAEICRVTRKYVIISLPNPYNAFLNYLKTGDYQKDQHIKFYGLPADVPKDRHKWFFSVSEAEQFIKIQAKKNRMKIIQIDFLGRIPKFKSVDNLFNKILLGKDHQLLSRIIKNRNLFRGTLWVVLKKKI